MVPVKSFSEIIKGNPYPGRGIITGMSPNDKAVLAYFIMGRSENSRNRVFVKTGDEVMIKPFVEEKVEDPSLIIYYPVKVFENFTVVTNGNQTDTVIDYLIRNERFEDALNTRMFEPDAPNWTPRISGILEIDEDAGLTYALSILKASDSEGDSCDRFYYNYEPIPGFGHLIHTYETDGNPLPTFIGEPRRVNIPEDIDAFTDEIWESLDPENKISLYVRYIDTGNLSFEDRLLNKNL